jgi:ATP-dependent Clp protease ATP-binding subunit ClpC
VVQLFERFTDTARRVVVYAKEEALLLDHDHIGTEHILLGLLRDDTETAVQILTALGAGLPAARAQAEEIAGRGSQAPIGDIPFTARAKKVLELSLREALQLGHNYIGSEHILLGLIREGEGGGAEILKRLGVDTEKVRRDILTGLRVRQQPRPAPGVFSAGGGMSAIESRLTAMEERLERIERLLRDGSGRDSA